jgi:hypothetical protein
VDELVCDCERRPAIGVDDDGNVLRTASGVGERGDEQPKPEGDDRYGEAP